MIAHIRKVKRCGLFAGMGIGKTSAVILALIQMRIMGEIDSKYPTLVIAPARVARDTWGDELAKWTQFEGLTLVALYGTPKQRLRKLHMKADIYTISYELLPWLVDYYMAKWPFKNVVADELDRLKGFREKRGGVTLESKKSGASGERAHALGKIAHNLTDRWINMGGTPMPAGLKDLWGSTWYLDRGARLGRTYTDFKKRWFRRRWSGQGIEPLPYAHSQITEALKDICLTVDPKDYFDLHEPRINEVVVKLPPAVRKLYNKMEKELFIKLDSGEEIDAFTEAGLINKCLQLANGAIYTTHPEWAEVHNEKIEALESIKHEAAGMPLLVQYAFKSDKARILKHFKDAVDISTPKGLKAFKAGEYAMGVAHAESMGHGVDGLQYVTNQLVQFGHIYKAGAVQQFIERIGPMRQFQAGFEREVVIHRIIAANTRDRAVIHANAHNWSVQDSTLHEFKAQKLCS